MDWSLKFHGDRRNSREDWRQAMDVAVEGAELPAAEIAPWRESILDEIGEDDESGARVLVIVSVECTTGRVELHRHDGAWTPDKTAAMRRIQHGARAFRIVAKPLAMPPTLARVDGTAVCELAVAEFGAVGDDQADDGPSLQQAIDKLARSTLIRRATLSAQQVDPVDPPPATGRRPSGPERDAAALRGSWVAPEEPASENDRDEEPPSDEDEPLPEEPTP